MSGWYIRRGEKIVGPADLAKLRELVADGRLLPTDQLAKDIAGPWQEAGSTKLFAEQPATPSTTIVRTPAAPPPAVLIADREPPAPSIVSKGLTVFAAIGRGMLVTGGAMRRAMATRSQRKHEIKLARIQASAVKSPAPPTTARPPAAPTIHQTTVVQVVNKNKNAQTIYGCSGCGTLLLLIILAVIALAIFSQ